VLVTFSQGRSTLVLLTVVNGTAEQYTKEGACHFQSWYLYYSTFNSHKDTVVLRMPALAALFVPGSLHY
jgi:hypothetical protein